MNAKQDKIKYISYLQIIGIILVVLGHSFHEYPGESHGADLLLYRMMYSFRMPVFMFTSGFLLVVTTSRKPRGWGRFAATKVRRLVVPFLFLQIVAFLPRVMMSSIADDSIEMSVSSFVDSLLYGEHLVIPYFWFLHSSFTLLLAVYGFIMVSRRFGIGPRIYYPALAMTVVALNCLPLGVGTFMSAHMTLYLAIFFIAGCGYGEWNAEVERVVEFGRMRFFVFSAILWAVTFIYGYDQGYFARVICSLFGIAMVISLARLLDRHHVTILDHLIGSNYIIFLLSWFFNVATQQVLAHFITLPWWLHTILSLTTGIYMPWYIYRTLQNNPDRVSVNRIAFLLGQTLRTPAANYDEDKSSYSVG